MTDYYSILNITKQASQNEIKQAYKKLALKYHPDKQNGDTAQFQKIQEAYDTLCDPAKRERYDGGGLNFQPTHTFNSFFNFHFNQQNVKKANSVYTCKITLEDVYFGTIKKIKVKRNVLCKTCTYTCEICNGRGSKKIQHSFGPIVQVSETVCHACQGHGWKSHGNVSNNCTCIENKKTEEKIFEIVINHGIENGKTFTFPEWGEQSYKKDEVSGDLIIIIDTEPHKHFERHNFDIVHQIDISLKESIVGKKLEIPLFDELLGIDSIGFGVINPNKQYIIYNKGIKNDKNERGNLLLRFNIIYPDLVLTHNDQLILIDAFNKTGFKHL
jgi:DnaJ family protein A protein 2